MSGTSHWHYALRKGGAMAPLTYSSTANTIETLFAATQLLFLA
jgi:hypothetical protein